MYVLCVCVLFSLLNMFCFNVRSLCFVYTFVQKYLFTAPGYGKPHIRTDFCTISPLPCTTTFRSSVSCHCIQVHVSRVCSNDITDVSVLCVGKNISRSTNHNSPRTMTGWRAVFRRHCVATAPAVYVTSSLDLSPTHH